MPARHLEASRLGMPATSVLLGDLAHVHAIVCGAQAEHRLGFQPRLQVPVSDRHPMPSQKLSVVSQTVPQIGAKTL